MQKLNSLSLSLVLTSTSSGYTECSYVKVNHLSLATTAYYKSSTITLNAHAHKRQVL